MLTILLLLLLAFGTPGIQHAKAQSYFLSIKGNDANDGSIQHPWQSISKLNRLQLHAGDSVFLMGRDRFTGTISIDSADGGSQDYPVVLTSYGSGLAIINSVNDEAISVKNSRHIDIKNLVLLGSGRKSGNTKNGCSILWSAHINISGIEVSGFQKSGLLIYASQYIKAFGIRANNNGFAGISVDGTYGSRLSNHIIISNSIAENNPGDPTNLGNHSGNGILVGNCKNAIVEHCIATNNGWDMPRQGNGPVGIWCYEADSIIFRSCISYRNKTSPGAYDGGGFDFDGGTTNSVMEDCLSYENMGSGFGIFQYDGASQWRNNAVRRCISLNDGNGIAFCGSIYIWNGARDLKQMNQMEFNQNIIINDTGWVVAYNVDNLHAGFQFFDNYFISQRSLARGKDSSGTDNFFRNSFIKKNPGSSLHIPDKPEKIKDFYAAMIQRVSSDSLKMKDDHH